MIPTYVGLAIAGVGLIILIALAYLDDPYERLKVKETDAQFRARLDYQTSAWMRAEARFIEREGRVPTTHELIAERSTEWT